LKLHVHPLGRHVVAAVVAVGFAKADAEPLRLVQLGRGQQEQHLPADAWLGSAAAQVAHEHSPVDGMAGPNRVCGERLEELLSAGEPSVEEVGLAIALLKVGPITVNACVAHRFSIPATIVVTYRSNNALRARDAGPLVASNAKRPVMKIT